MPVKSRFHCQQCGCVSPRWMGRCPGCGQWNTMVEEVLQSGTKSLSKKNVGIVAVEMNSVAETGGDRFVTGTGELDRVLGGGIVPGSIILLGGDPGIGKSTLLLQVSGAMGGIGKTVLYVSGEESTPQIKLRASRLGIGGVGIFLLAETDIEQIERIARDTNPHLMVIDSIQTVYNTGMSSAPGGVGQVRECGAQIMRLAKTTGISVFLVGHVTKDGMLAGPRVLEHMVDTVLYFEGDKQHSHRILRSVKNRFGSTREIGIFRMQGSGLAEVNNPSELFLMSHPQGNVAGSVVVPALEGSRPLLVEIQALVCPTGYGTPRRMTAGVDYNRVALIMAVLEKRVGMNLGGQDAYVNAVGGVRLEEPGVDLAIALALASSFRDVPVNGRAVALGEIGLTGEVRPVPSLEKRLLEAARLGFSHCIVPSQGNEELPGLPPNIKVSRVETVYEAIEAALAG